MFETLVVFDENFDGLKSSDLTGKNWTLDNSIIDSNCKDVLSVLGYAITPVINNLDGSATLTFKCKTTSSSNQNDKLIVTILNGETIVKTEEIIVLINSYQNESITFQGVTGMQVKFASGTANHYIRIDDVTVSVERLASPSFDLPEGYFRETQTTTITNNETGATVYYTTDGTDPTDQSTP